MGKSTDVKVKEVSLYFLDAPMRIPLKFGGSIVEHAACARARLRLEDSSGRFAEGWGETPLGVHWSWPSNLCPCSALLNGCTSLPRSAARPWSARGFDTVG